jgi:hypothetical protein
MSFPDDFEREALYTRPAWVLTRLEAIRPGGEVVAEIDTAQLSPLLAPWVEAQQVGPAHPRHVPGALLVQATATLGNLHAVYVLGLRPSEGWAGFGTHLRRARFGRLGRFGPPIRATLSPLRARQLRGTWFTDYAFLFEQEGHPLYESEQTAAWTRTPA